jgi:hypothetical protein
MTLKMNFPKKHTAINIAKTGYEASVISRAIERAPNNMNLHGHIQEVLLKDQLNLKGSLTSHTSFSAAKNDAVADLVTKNLNGKVMNTLQVKDLDPKNVGSLAKQVSNGKYRSTQLIGSPETTKAYNKIAQAKDLPTMTDSKISGHTTRDLAKRSGIPQKASTPMFNASACHQSGITGAQISGGIAIAKGVYDFASGKKNMNEVGKDIVVESAKGYATTFVASGAATTAAAISTSIIGAGAISTVALPVVAAAGTAMVAGVVFDNVAKPLITGTLDLAGDLVGGTFDLAGDLVGGTFDLAGDLIDGIFDLF